MFSQLNPEEKKILHYVKSYMDYIKSVDTFFTEGKNIQKVDNRIQHAEIIDHLIRHNIDPNEESTIKQQETILWANINSKNFRRYLNSIKLVTLILYAWGIHNTDDITEEKLLDAIKLINNFDGILLNQIYLE